VLMLNVQRTLRLLLQVSLCYSLIKLICLFKVMMVLKNWQWVWLLLLLFLVLLYLQYLDIYIYEKRNMIRLFYLMIHLGKWLNLLIDIYLYIISIIFRLELFNKQNYFFVIILISVFCSKISKVKRMTCVISKNYAKMNIMWKFYWINKTYQSKNSFRIWRLNTMDIALHLIISSSAIRETRLINLLKTIYTQKVKSFLFLFILMNKKKIV
jgi:hypothetical protein